MCFVLGARASIQRRGSHDRIVSKGLGSLESLASEVARDSRGISEVSEVIIQPVKWNH